jgi:hypothetical protein
MRMPWFAVVMIILIGVVFYVGLSTNTVVFARAAQQLIYALTGADEQGRTRQYAGGAPAFQSLPYGITTAA